MRDRAIVAKHYQNSLSKKCKEKESTKIAIAAIPCSRLHDANYSRLSETSRSMMPLT